jgi:drug/metabolite transporter (DMT)-like permease
MAYLYVLVTIIFTVYGQIILKWRINSLQVELPVSLEDKFMRLIMLFTDFYILSAFISAFLASLFWMAAMTKIELTKAYPFMSLAPVLVFLIGVGFLGETFTWGKIIGLVFVIIGMIFTVKY